MGRGATCRTTSSLRARVRAEATAVSQLDLAPSRSTIISKSTLSEARSVIHRPDQLPGQRKQSVRVLLWGGLKRVAVLSEFEIRLVVLSLLRRASRPSRPCPCSLPSPPVLFLSPGNLPLPLSSRHSGKANQPPGSLSRHDGRPPEPSATARTRSSLNISDPATARRPVPARRRPAHRRAGVWNQEATVPPGSRRTFLLL